MSRGITVCDRWRGEYGFINFLSDMGNRPSIKHSLDRFPNNDGNYEPTNCRWATKPQQNRNTRSNTYLEYNGEVMIITDWAKKIGCKKSSNIYYFLRKGKDLGFIINHYKNVKRRKNVKNIA